MKIAVVGAGISGLGAAWLLSAQHEVHLFESEPRLGGHAHTVDVTDDAGRMVSVDTGFLVYNEVTYPNLCGFFRALGVVTAPSDMSLSIRLPQRNFEWAGNDLNSVFGQRLNLFRPRFLRMLTEILRFGREAEKNVQLSRAHTWTLGDLLKAGGYSDQFRDDYLIPAGAAIWSTPEDRMLEFPAETFLTFFINHQLLQVTGRPIWRTVQNGSRNYVEKAAAKIQHVHLASAVTRVERKGSVITVSTKEMSADFDRVVLATHVPITRRILANPTALENEVLSNFKTEDNLAVLHASADPMPSRKRCWASWNVLGSSGLPGSPKASLTYYLNRLQPLPTETDFFVTLNPRTELSSTLRRFQYAHPQFDQRSIDAQKRLPEIQGGGGVYFAGAWSRYGFHEDGLRSGVNVAKLLGVEIPW